MQQKTLIAVLLAGVLATTACENKKHETQDNKSVATTADTTVPDPVEVLETADMVVEENLSDAHFLAALDAYEQKKMPQAAQQLQEGIDAFKQETSAYSGKSKKLVQATVATLEKLKERTQKGEATDRQVLDNAIAEAQNATTHHVLFVVEETLMPEKAQAATENFSKALVRLEKSVEKGNAVMKADGEKLVSEGRMLEAKLKKDANGDMAGVKDFTARCKKWLEKQDQLTARK